MSSRKPAPKREWVWISDNPPTVRYEDELWLVCPVKGFECARVPRSRFSVQMGEDVMAVHVQIMHRPWS